MWFPLRDIFFFPRVFFLSFPWLRTCSPRFNRCAAFFFCPSSPTISTLYQVVFPALSDCALLFVALCAFAFFVNCRFFRVFCITIILCFSLYIFLHVLTGEKEKNISVVPKIQPLVCLMKHRILHIQNPVFTWFLDETFPFSHLSTLYHSHRLDRKGQTQEKTSDEAFFLKCLRCLKRLRRLQKIYFLRKTEHSGA